MPKQRPDLVAWSYTQQAGGEEQPNIDPLVQCSDDPKDLRRMYFTYETGARPGLDHLTNKRQTRYDFPSEPSKPGHGEKSIKDDVKKQVSFDEYLHYDDDSGIRISSTRKPVQGKPSSSTTPGKEAEGEGVVRYADAGYNGNVAGQLTFIRGDRITNIKPHSTNPYRSTGRDHQGNEGHFPTSLLGEVDPTLA
ncbi:hypothetical protein LTR56_018372 [Elasticomyces elasticus]|nr:hypothetical protein LTR56_018372 [Elasticomyces elasticus]KAK3637282.1 hypothetical protein LTR22_018316 [Elasticomyces elasticus]KAK4916445.1 hypothetical protein LTR49_015543 [Elasticomyces elasticus]KAK5756008.1 hypothetical protein LTS12_013897 [Elasticomyces elasticus]